jgi:hypothetical protein
MGAALRLSAFRAEPGYALDRPVPVHFFRITMTVTVYKATPVMRPARGAGKSCRAAGASP